MPILIHDSIESMASAMDWIRIGLIHEDVEIYLDNVENDTDINGRKRRDAEVLTTAGANANGPILEIGTSHGHSAFRFATNVPKPHVVHTVNILPEQYTGSAEMVTHLLRRDQIGAFYRAQGVQQRIVQHYADTLGWTPPAEISELSVAFVDGAHDSHAVLSDSRLCWARLAERGLLMWHDFNPGLRHRFSWIDASMRGIEFFLTGEELYDPVIHHLRHSWIGVLVKDKTARIGAEKLAAQLNPTEAILVVGRSGMAFALEIYKLGFQRVTLLTPDKAEVLNKHRIFAFLDDRFNPQRLPQRNFSAIVLTDREIYIRAGKTYLKHLAKNGKFIVSGETININH